MSTTFMASLQEPMIDTNEATKLLDSFYASSEEELLELELSKNFVEQEIVEAEIELRKAIALDALQSSLNTLLKADVENLDGEHRLFYGRRLQSIEEEFGVNIDMAGGVRQTVKNIGKAIKSAIDKVIKAFQKAWVKLIASFKSKGKKVQKLKMVAEKVNLNEEQLIDLNKMKSVLPGIALTDGNVFAMGELAGILKESFDLAAGVNAVINLMTDASVWQRSMQYTANNPQDGAPAWTIIDDAFNWTEVTVKAPTTFTFKAGLDETAVLRLVGQYNAGFFAGQGKAENMPKDFKQGKFEGRKALVELLDNLDGFYNNIERINIESRRNELIKTAEGLELSDDSASTRRAYMTEVKSVLSAVKSTYKYWMVVGTSIEAYAAGTLKQAQI
jgi:hypothetical protein